MASEASKFVLGFFILATGVVVVGFILAFGSGRLLVEPMVLVSYFDESVQGLEVGSPVKWRGVQAGRVSAITLHGDAKRVCVFMEVDPQQFDLVAVEENLVNEDRIAVLRQTVRAKVATGLRSQLGLTGITGMKYVELDYLAPPGQPASEEAPPAVEDTVYIPSVSSNLARLQETFGETADRLAAIDFVGLANDLKGLLESASAILDDPALKSTMGHLEQTTSSFNRFVTRVDATIDHKIIAKVMQDVAAFGEDLRSLSGRVRHLISEDVLNKAIADIESIQASLKSIAVKFEDQLDTMDLAGTTRDARRAFNKTAEAAVVVEEVRVDLKRALLELSDTLRGVRRLAEALERNPSVLVRGKAQADREEK